MIFRYILTPLILAELNYDSCRLIQDLYPDLGVNLVLFFKQFLGDLMFTLSSMVGIVNMNSLLHAEDTYYIPCYHAWYC